MNAEQILKSDEFRKILDFHGHLCPGLCIGYRAAKAGIGWLKENRAEDEELVAIVENDACGADAVQALTGCTFGKGNFIFKDHGKQVFTFISRESGKAVRIALKPQAIESRKVDDEILRKVRENSATEEEKKIYNEARLEKTYEILEKPAEELFAIKQVDMPLPSKARIESSIPCDCCGEPAMPSRMERADGRKVCRACLNRQ